jgi:hypothetical protein
MAHAKMSKIIRQAWCRPMSELRPLTHADFEQLGFELFAELVGLRERAHALPYSATEQRLRLSLRAVEIGQEIKALVAEAVK